MARILCVDDKEFWLRFIKNQLPDHYVDGVRTFQEAVDLLQSKPAYAVALVDLNLRGDDDGEGGGLLELLRSGYPETKRIAVTGTPPGGAITRLIAGYGLEDLIIKGKFRIPDLRHAVQEAIAARPGELSQSLRLNRWMLQQRSRDWQRIQSDRVEREVTAAEKHLSDVIEVRGGPRGEARKEAEEAVLSARRRAERLSEVSTRLREIVMNIKSEADFDVALTAQEEAEEQFRDDGTGPGR